MALHLRRASGLSLAFLAACLAFAGVAPRAVAEFEVAPDGFSARALDSEGNPEDLTGSHPDRLQIDFALNLDGSTARDLVFELPPGLGMNAAAVPRCSRQIVEAEEECPVESRVGTFTIVLSGGGTANLPLFELEPPPGGLTEIGTKPSFSLPVAAELRPDDFGITVTISDLPEEPIAEGHLDLWGVPADRQEGTDIPRRALLSLPSTCGLLSFSFRTRSREEDAPWLSASADVGPLVGCEDLDFEPGLAMQLSDPVADSPTGMRAELHMPEEASADERAQAQIEDVSIEMPAGVGVSPGGAARLTACSDDQFGLDEDGEARCPPSSRVGSIELASPAIEGALSGEIYLGEERPDQRLRVFVVTGAAGTEVKFAGALQVDPGSDRLAMTVSDLPPLSISRMAMIFEGGPGALLATPLECGAVSTVAKFVPYGGGAPVDALASVPIAPLPPATACATAPFSPQLVFATSTYRAGRQVSFSSTVRRRQGEQLTRRLTMRLPAGLSARLGDVQQCSPADIATATCPPDSRLGSVRAEIGSGPSIATLYGGLHLTGPYRRAPFGLQIELPATVGPFDLGTVSLRGAAEVSSRNGQLIVTTDPLPASIEGIPVRFQTIELSLDRPGLVSNPTGCSATALEATMEAQNGAIASSSQPFQARGCRRLGFGLDARMVLFGDGELHRGGRPGLRMSLRVPAKSANLRSVRFSLPDSLGFAISGLDEICSRLDARDGSCPVGSRIGSVLGETSLLDEPFRGGIYVAQPDGNGLPDIWARLSSSGVEVNTRGTITRHHGRLAMRLAGLPDLSLSSLQIHLGAGSRSTLSLGVDPCPGGRSRRLVSAIAAKGQNGARRTFSLRVRTKPSCAARHR